MSEQQIISSALALSAGPPAPLPRALADLIAEVIGRGRSPNTRRAYAADLSDFFTYLLGAEGAIQLPVSDGVADQAAALREQAGPLLARLTQVSERDIQAYLSHLSAGPGKGGLAPATVARRLTPLRLLFARLLRHRLIALDPTADVRGPRLSGRSATVYLSREQARSLEAACNGPTVRDLRDLAIVRLMLRTGLRAGEVCALELGGLQQVDGHTVAWVRGKGGARERVKLPPPALRAIRAYLDAAGLTEGPLFRRLRPAPRQAGGYRVSAGRLSYTGLKHILLARFAAAGLRELLDEGDDEPAADGARRRQGPTPHSLRHTFVTLALKGGASIAQAQAAARHRSPQTTMRYAHDLDDLDNNAVDYVNY